MSARVKGPTDHVVIVGAGLGGLSAALRLAGAGRKVTVIERESVPGGRNGLLNKSGYAFDTGPSVLTIILLMGSPWQVVHFQYMMFVILLQHHWPFLSILLSRILMLQEALFS